ncbi:ABC transporter ATP-binding protein [Microtetraspora malaysiensis]|uniref:ABC transporter ATP-binding protein n=1 Tax=Microtetraspora malaysiensis TaxID=161358 RepID=UPI001C3F2A12|nr:ABC transporter ATP-binding protein [Microtetraspora malaysiensis]
MRLVDGFSLDIAPAERVALVGESGSGKSITARAIMRLAPQTVTSGSIEFDGLDLGSLPERAMTRLRGRRIGMVFQDPMRALNPLMTIGDQLTESLRDEGVGKSEAVRRAVAILEEIGVPNAAQRLRAYPHEFSGGMRQRVAIAIALIGEPDLLIADEPTTALDVRVQRQVLQLLDRIARDRSLAVLLITHDLGLVANFVDRVAVMYAGRKVEDRRCWELFEQPAHPYTQALLATVLRLDRPVTRPKTIPGAPPHPAGRPNGCAFHPRCELAAPECSRQVPSLRRLAKGGEVACDVVGRI